MPRSALLPGTLELCAVGSVDDGLLGFLGEELAGRLGVRARRGGALPLPAEWLEADGRQVCSNLIVDALLAELRRTPLAPGGYWLLAVAEVDLFAPGREWVFGEAALGGGCAVVGTARLRPSAQRGLLEPSLFTERVLKEAIHELGHAAGIEHCRTPICVMAESYDAEDVDRKGTRFCHICSALLDRLRRRGGG